LSKFYLKPPEKLLIFAVVLIRFVNK